MPEMTPVQIQEMFQGIAGIADLQAARKLKIAIVGEQKTGKSWFALSIPGTTFVADFDDRIESIKEFINTTKRTDIIAKTYKDKNPSSPNAMLDFEADIGMLEYSKQQGKAIPENYVLDSMTFVKSAAERELMRQQSSLCRTIKMGSNTMRIPQGWDVVNGIRQYMEHTVNRLSELGNLIVVFHEMDEKDAALSTKEEKKYTGRKTINPQYLSTLLSTFNDVYRVTIDYSGNRIATIKPDSNFLAATSFSKLNATEAPNLAEIIRKGSA